MLAAMTRGIVLMIALSCPAWGQTIAAQKAFLHRVEALMKREPPVDGVSRVREELGLTAESAEAVIAAVRVYNTEADRLEQSMRRSILTRRLQVAGEFKVTYSSELDLVNWVNLDLNLFLLEQMEELAERLGEDEYAKIAQYIGRLLPVPIPGTWQQSPASFWRDSVKEPLSRPDAASLFVQHYKDALLPPQNLVPFLEGTVVSVTSSDERGRKVLLAMQEGLAAEVALLIDGEAWHLKGEPRIGEVVRFSGAALEFTPDPFLILFVPDRITGLVVESTEPNLPFTVPGLAR